MYRTREMGQMKDTDKEMKYQCRSTGDWGHKEVRENKKKVEERENIF